MQSQFLHLFSLLTLPPTSVWRNAAPLVPIPTPRLLPAFLPPPPVAYSSSLLLSPTCC